MEKSRSTRERRASEQYMPFPRFGKVGIALVGLSATMHPMPQGAIEKFRMLSLVVGEKRIREITGALPYPIMIHDDAGKIEFLNPTWERLTGYSLADTPTLADWERKAFGAPELSFLSCEEERQVVTSEGDILFWEFCSVALGPLSSGRQGFLRTALDLTARRRAERARRENAEKFSALAEESPLGIVIARDDAVIYCNSTAAGLFGLPPPQSQGLALGEWLHALPAEAGPVLGPLLRAGESRADPFRMGSGEGTWIEAFAKRVGAASGDMIMVTFLDVTERFHAEERERIQRRKLIQAEKLASLGELVAGVAHEINNPNHSIALNADIIAELWASAAPILDRALEGRESDLVGGMEWAEARTEAPQLLSGIAAASRDIDAIVRGLKDYARGEAKPEVEEVALNLVVKAALTLFSNYIKKATGRLVLKLEEDMPPVRAHFQRLEQVAVNLLQNACQALTDPDQAIRVSTSYDEASGIVRLIVADEGRGMSPELLERIKDPFFTTKHDLGGVGLGVSISESIVVEYGGRLEYASDAGKGTVATVSLPAARAHRGPP
jgi:signal transduction histidine kinase